MSSPKQQPRAALVANSAPDSNTPPWPEWSDAYINNMQWNLKTTKVLSSSSKSHQQTLIPSSNQDPEEHFEDPAGFVKFPEDIHVDSWVQPHVWDTNTNYFMKPDTNLDLIGHNKHVMKYQIMRLIAGSIMCLEKEASHRPFPIEFQSDQFQSTGGPVWKPWHHVYAFSPAGKGKTHTMAYNGYGKYVVRLFYMGQWRRILVDDRLPLSAEGSLLLPVSQPHNLWLPVLSKALLRVAALSWTEHSHVEDFSVIHCLTGWIPTTVPCRGISNDQLWCLCCQVLDNTEDVVASPGCCASAADCPEDLTFTDQSANESRVVFAGIMSPLHSPLETSSPSTSLEYLLLIRNVRFDNNSAKPLWKEYRWNDWAYNKGIISDILKCTTNRRTSSTAC